jgi:HSP20 family protein
LTFDGQPDNIPFVAAQFSFIPSGEARELTEDVRELFADLAAHLDHGRRAYSGECHPTLDVLETDEAVEVLVDASGIPAEALRVLFRGGMLLVVGEKAPPPATDEQTFHLVEREFGRFARVVRLSGAFDVTRARASVENGELTIVLPKRVDRRDQSHRIAVANGRRE